MSPIVLRLKKFRAVKKKILLETQIFEHFTNARQKLPSQGVGVGNPNFEG